MDTDGHRYTQNQKQHLCLSVVNPLPKELGGEAREKVAGPHASRVLFLPAGHLEIEKPCPSIKDSKEGEQRSRSLVKAEMSRSKRRAGAIAPFLTVSYNAASALSNGLLATMCHL